MRKSLTYLHSDTRQEPSPPPVSNSTAPQLFCVAAVVVVCITRNSHTRISRTAYARTSESDRSSRGACRVDGVFRRQTSSSLALLPVLVGCTSLPKPTIEGTERQLLPRVSVSVVLISICSCPSRRSLLFLPVEQKDEFLATSHRRQQMNTVVFVADLNVFRSHVGQL